MFQLLDACSTPLWQESLWRTESDASVKPTASTSQADTHLEGSPESKDIQNEGATKASSSTLKSDGDRTTPTAGDVKSKLKKPLSKNSKLRNPDNKHDASITREKWKEDAKELPEAAERQGSGADEPAEDSSQPPSAQRRRRPGSPAPRPKKRSRQLFSGGTHSCFEADDIMVVARRKQVPTEVVHQFRYKYTIRQFLHICAVYSMQI